jgi:hypothetical protein
MCSVVSVERPRMARTKEVQGSDATGSPFTDTDTRFGSFRAGSAHCKYGNSGGNSIEEAH